MSGRTVSLLSLVPGPDLASQQAAGQTNTFEIILSWIALSN
jgi:hypothetical protein